MASSFLTPPTSPDLHTAPCIKLRDDIAALLLPENASTSDNPFFPRSRIQHICTESRILEALECSCHRCCKQRQHFSIGNVSNHKSILRDAVLLFALLVYSETPSLIYFFLARSMHDDYLEKNCGLPDPAHLVKTIRFMKINVAEKIYWNSFMFFVPRLETHDYSEYASPTILPFLNETRLGYENEEGEVISDGSFGAVFAFTIPDEYRCFPGFSHVRRFARKELYTPTPHNRFLFEYHNLLRVKELQDEHLIQVVKAYKHGDRYNFIFPCARTNLARYLREPELCAFAGHFSLHSHPIWNQMLGIARGLNKVLDFTSLDGEIRFGYHLDLKPENILVSNSDILSITDFGQATFKKASDDASSVITGMGGSESYAPPEIDERYIQQNRRYDIWSLGCIFLEACAFVTRGTVGVLGLDRVRRTSAVDSNYEDDRFFRRKPKSNAYELKPEVSEWMEILPHEVDQGQGRDFLQGMLSIIKRMLDVNAGTRSTSKDVCIALDQLLSRFQSPYKEQPASPNLLTRPILTGKEFGRELVYNLQDMSYNLQGFWKSGKFRFAQQDYTLCIQTLEGYQWEETVFGSRSQLRFIPRYVLRHRQAWGTGFFSDTSIYLSYCSSPSGSARRFVRFSMDEMATIFSLQEVLTGHAVFESKSWKAQRFTARLRLPKNAKISLRRKVEEADRLSTIVGEAHNIQLWTNSSYMDIKKMAMASASKQLSPRPLCLGASLRRIVIFADTSIIIIRLAKNLRIRKEDHIVCNPQSIDLVPTDVKADPSFKISIYQTGSDGAPSIPLGRSKFEMEEEANILECESLTLMFTTVAEAQSFHRAYKRTKKAWTEDTRNLSRMRSRIGEELGWSQF